MDQKQVISTLNRYAQSRQKDVSRGLESAALSALLVEKYAVGMIDAIRSLNLTESIDINTINEEADRLCTMICPDHVQLRTLRYERYSDLDLSKPRTTS